MYRRIAPIALILLLALLGGIHWSQSATAESPFVLGKDIPIDLDWIRADESPSALGETFVTTITVNTTEDVDNSLSRTCSSATDGKCTFRRAIVEASGLAPSERPVLIQFDIPTTDSNYEREAPGTWTVMVDKGALPALKTQSITDKTGRVTIDGNTQPGGRTDGPKIFIHLGDHSLQIESTDNTIRNLAFIVMGSIVLKEDGNTVENNWMGLSGDGQSLVLRTPGDPKRLAIGGGVTIRSDNNIVQRNAIAGAFARAIDVDGGDNNQIRSNVIGARADGTVPDVPSQSECVASFNYDPQNWYGGWGISVSGSNNTVENNLLVGMQNLRAANDTAPMALEIFGSGHTIRRNVIGIDLDDPANDFTGVCGQGIKVSGSNTRIVENVIARSRPGFESNQGSLLDGAILYSDDRFSPGGITLSRNLVFQGPGKVYAFGPKVVQDLRLFRPARITGINGTTVTGSNGMDPDGNPSACPNCRIEFFLDGTNADQDALAYLGSTTADANGDFTFTLSQPLKPGQGIRTSSTTASANIIGTLAMSTTTQFSGLYIKQAKLTISGPTTGDENKPHKFTYQVTPVSLAGPITYTVQATDKSSPSVNTTDATTVSHTILWNTPGVKVIQVTADNGLISASATYTITIGDVPSGGSIYLPFVTR